MPKGGRRSRAGRRRRPTDLKVIQGTFRKDRHANELPRTDSDGPRFPKAPSILRLSPRQRKLWRLVGKHCDAWTALSDWPTVWGLVCLLEQLIHNHEAQLETEESGHPLAFKHTVIEKPVMGPTGPERQELTFVEAKSNPLISDERKICDKLRPYIAMLGLSPVDRARMPKMTSKPAAADPLAALIARGKR